MTHFRSNCYRNCPQMWSAPPTAFAPSVLTLRCAQGPYECYALALPNTYRCSTGAPASPLYDIRAFIKIFMICLHIIQSYLIDSSSHNPLNILPYIHSLWSSHFIKYECLIRHYYRNCLISHILYSLKNDIINHWRHDWFLIIFNELSDYLCLHT